MSGREGRSPGRGSGAGRPRLGGRPTGRDRTAPGQGGTRSGQAGQGRPQRPAHGPRPTGWAAGPGRPVEPPLPEEVTARELDPAVRRELASLGVPAADAVARHLVMAQRLLPEDPQGAYAHAAAAARRAGRLAVVREAAGLAAYAAGRWAEALRDLRAARRMAGTDALLPVLADCERGLGRPDRALELATDPGVARLDQAGRVEMYIVAAGARRDLGQPAAAVLALQVPELTLRPPRPWSHRLWYAYADALLAAGRVAEARHWFAETAAVDGGLTDAAERVAEIDGVVFLDDAEGPGPGAE